MSSKNGCSDYEVFYYHNPKGWGSITKLFAFREQRGYGAGLEIGLIGIKGAL